jgi:cytochrome c
MILMHQRKAIGPIAAVAFVSLVSMEAFAQENPQVQRGRQFAQTNCGSCHQTGRVGQSPLKVAPPFRTLHQRYPVENLAEALAEGIVTGHPTMPQFRLDPGQVGDFIAYLKSLER